MYGDGASSRDYTFVEDVVRGVLASYDRIGAHGYRIWNLGGSSPVPLAEMIATIGRVVGREPRIKPLPMQPGDVDRTWADLTRSAAELDYRPRTPFEEASDADWLKARHGNAERDRSYAARVRVPCGCVRCAGGRWRGYQRRVVVVDIAASPPRPRSSPVRRAVGRAAAAWACDGRVPRRA